MKQNIFFKVGESRGDSDTWRKPQPDENSSDRPSYKHRQDRPLGNRSENIERRGGDRGGDRDGGEWRVKQGGDDDQPRQRKLMDDDRGGRGIGGGDRGFGGRTGGDRGERGDRSDRGGPGGRSVKPNQSKFQESKADTSDNWRRGGN